MPNHTGKKRPRDPNELAKQLVDEATNEESDSDSEDSEAEESPKAKSGRKGGLKGGRARAEKLTPEERKEIAEKAARARWGEKT